MSLSYAHCHDVLQYDDGKLYWQVAKRGIGIGTEAGCYTGEGQYKRVQLQGKRYLMHRVIFLMHYGYLPTEVDHRDGDIHNNRIENLRAATSSQNKCNKLSKGYGLHQGRWRVRLVVNGKQRHFGSFEDEDLAALVASEAKEKYHREFSRKLIEG